MDFRLEGEPIISDLSVLGEIRVARSLEYGVIEDCMSNVGVHIFDSVASGLLDVN